MDPHKALGTCALWRKPQNPAGSCVTEPPGAWSGQVAAQLLKPPVIDYVGGLLQSPNRLLRFPGARPNANRSRIFVDM